MSQGLSPLLVAYQAAVEADILKVTKHMEEPEENFFRNICEKIKITAADLSREYSADDVKQLCLRTKVRVNMTLFNCVWDAKKRFDRKGRLSSRSERYVNSMLIKAVSRKMVVPYSAKRISNCNHIRQCQLKKDNNLRLNRWRLEPQSTPDTNCDWIDAALQINSESMEILDEDLETQQSENSVTQISEDYSVFGIQVPNTSTPAQSMPIID